MSRDKIYQSIWAAVIGWCIAFGSLGCMATGFDLLSGSRLVSLGAWCLLWAVALSALNLLRFAPWSALVLGLVLLWRWFYGPLAGSAERLVYEVSSVYHQGYGWKVLYWTSHPTAGTLTGIFRAMALVALWPICACVTRRGSVWSAMPLALLPLGSTLLMTDTVPQSGYLLLYLFGVTVLLLTQGVRRRQASQGNALSVQIALPVALLLGLIFLLNPVKSYNKQHLAEKLDKAVASLIGRVEEMEPPQITMPPIDDFPTPAVGDTGTHISLEDVGPKDRQNQVVMSVVASTNGRVYLRGASFADYDGLSWKVGDQEDKRSQWPVFAGDDPTQSLVITTKKEHSVLYLPYYAPELGDMEQGRVDNPVGHKTYYFNYTLLSAATPRQDSAASVAGSYTQLPRSTRQWAESKALEITGQAVDGKDPAQVVAAARQIGAYVSQSAKYSLDTPKIPREEEDFARWFLENSETGYCTHFATATAVLLRASGIPARYVSGYTVDARAEKSVNVVLGDAHAWVEYYVPGAGWMLLDPTPGNQVAPQLPPVQTPGPQTTPEETTAPDQTTPPAGTTLPENTQPGDTTQSEATTPEAQQPQEKKPADLSWLPYILWPLAVLALIWGQWFVRVRARRQKLRSDRGNRRALQYWRETERLATLLGEQPPEAIKQLAQKAKFSQHKLTREELQQMRSHLADCEKCLRKHPWYKQVLYRLVYALY